MDEFINYIKRLQRIDDLKEAAQDRNPEAVSALRNATNDMLITCPPFLETHEPDLSNMKRLLDESKEREVKTPDGEWKSMSDFLFNNEIKW